MEGNPLLLAKWLHKVLLLHCVQARIVASDRGTPPLTDVTLVTINILRNANAPTFSQTDITETVYEDDPITNIISTVTASDIDRAVSSGFAWGILHLIGSEGWGGRGRGGLKRHLC